MERAFGLVNALVIFLSGVLIAGTSFRVGMVVLCAAFALGVLASMVVANLRNPEHEGSSVR